jgi:hypothetical protein
MSPCEIVKKINRPHCILTLKAGSFNSAVVTLKVRLKNNNSTYSGFRVFK